MTNLIGKAENQDLNPRNDVEKQNEVDSLQEIASIDDKIILKDQNDSVSNLPEERNMEEYVNKMSVCLEEDDFFQNCKRNTKMDSSPNAIFSSCKKVKSEINNFKNERFLCNPEPVNMDIDNTLIEVERQTNINISMIKHINTSNHEGDENNMVENETENKITNQEDGPSTIQSEIDGTEVKNNNRSIENETENKITNQEDGPSTIQSEIDGTEVKNNNRSIENETENSIRNLEEDGHNTIGPSTIQSEKDGTEVKNNNLSIQNETENTIRNHQENDQITNGPSTIQNVAEETEVKNNNNQSIENEIQIFPSLAGEIYKIGLSQDNHGEEKLELVHGHEETQIKNKVLKYLPGLKINSVKKVQNNYLRGLYYLKKEEYVSRNISFEETSLFHATAEENVSSIIQDNFDWQRVWRSRYGTGISFASDADYANCHANRRSANIGAKRAFIIAKVLVGKSTVGSGCLRIPPKGYDTTTGANGLVIVKFNHNEFLPEYVVFYDCNAISTSKYYRL